MAESVAQQALGVKPGVHSEVIDLITSLAGEGQDDAIIIRPMYVDMTDDLVTGAVLSRIAFWFAPSARGKTKLRVARDGYLWLASDAADWWETTRVSEKQLARALNDLEERGWIEKRLYMFNNFRTRHIRLTQAFAEARARFIAAQVHATVDAAEGIHDDDPDSGGGLRLVAGGKPPKGTTGNAETERPVTPKGQDLLTETKTHSFPTEKSGTRAFAEDEDRPSGVGRASARAETPAPSSRKGTPAVESSPPPHPKQCSASPPPPLADDSHQAVCRAIVAAVAGDETGRKVLWEGHRGFIARLAKVWRAAGGTATSFEADYGPGGRWYTLPCRYAVVNGKATGRPTLPNIAETLGQLPNYQHWDAARIAPPRPVAPHAEVRMMSDEETASLAESERRAAQARIAANAAAMPEHFRRRIEARQAVARA